MNDAPGSDPMRLGVVLLAAGASQRMGRPKLVLAWGTKSILHHLIGQWRQVGCAQLAVVFAASNHTIADELERLGANQPDKIVNPTPEQGMFSSIRCAAAWTGWQKGLTHWAVALGDQPQVPVWILRELVGFAGTHSESVCQPGYRGRPRHPVLLPKTIFARLAQSNAPTLKHFLQDQPIAIREFDDERLAIDLDTPDDYRTAVERFL